MRFQTLSDWLQWQEQLHPKSIDLGLSRVHAVWRRMHAGDFACPVIIVGGTNGKGSCVAMLEAIYREAGYRVGAYTSPHLWRYNERIRIDGESVCDDAICIAFDHVDTARADTSLTYFEFGTLAALDIFKQAQLDVVILEVGLGGRLDAVNIIDADVSIVTSIDLDHMQWLGNDRESIAREKAGIFRGDNVGIVMDPSPPAALTAYAGSLGNTLLCVNRDFHYQAEQGSWSWHSGDSHRVGLPAPALSGEHQLRNAAGVIMAVESLQSRLPVALAHIRHGLLSVRLPGRFHYVAGDVAHVYDVAHNPAAARQLADTLRRVHTQGAVHAVFSALADKDIAGIIAPLCGLVTHWYIAPLAAARGASLQQIADAVQAGCPSAQQSSFTDLGLAYAQANQVAKPGDCVLVYGSFYTVAQTCPQGL
ncbi:MAG: bifunctional tetrahydrofolate synthase/dihydrofolate synthase [Gammaproteobacteria bacterium]|nr:bifunctional tetrahydrofolate synthase/dihydrofolate synthase [Gammaproteobacteria bacterium]